MKRDLELLYEIWCLRHTMRTWIKFMHLVPANVAEHTLRVIWIAIIIAKHEWWDIDLEKLVLMALVHDMNEVRWTDVNHVSKMYVEVKEREALQASLKWTIIEDQFLDLRDESSQKKTKESQIVKDADHLDVSLELQEMKITGSSFAAKIIEDRSVNIPEKLFTNSAKKLYQEILQWDPTDRSHSGINTYVRSDKF